jgi:non-specific serine/threonine protein kinase
MPVEVGKILSHYRLIEKLGEGGMGEVWRALDTKLDREIAIKFLPDSVTDDPVGLERFEREARAIAALNHPNIIVVHSIEQDAGSHFITMELVQGQALDELIREGPVPLKRMLEIAIATVDAVSAVHEREIAHRDLKPGNVMVTAGGQVKVLDFGLARSCKPARVEGAARDAETVTGGLTRDGAILGTPSYMSPEQIQGRPAGRRSDVFSLGILLYELATGRRPFGGTTLADRVASILKDTPRPTTQLNPELPRQLERIIDRCLDKKPAQRFASAVELRDALRELAHETGPGQVESVPSIAVLPFADMSADKDQDYFCEGIADEIINALTNIRDLRVASRTSSFRFKDAAMDSREIGDRLGVGTLLEGSVRKVGSHLRITAELINASDGYHRWSERYDRELEDIFAIQDEIAQSIVKALELKLSPRERRAIKQVATADVEAYEYYLRGRKFFYQYRRRSIDFATRMFSRAIELDPSYALAHAGIADCCCFVFMNTQHDEGVRQRADESSRRALELDADSAEAHSSRGVALSLMERHDEAEQQFEEALRLNPHLYEAHYFYARDSFTQGRLEKAIRLYDKASRLRPEDYQSLLLMAQIYDDLDRVDEARTTRLQGVERAERYTDLNPDDVRALYLGANGLVALGDRERGLEWARRAREIDPEEPMMLYNLSCIYALAGENDEAIDCLEQAIDHGFAHVPWIRQDNNLDGLRADPRFRKLIQRLGIQD